MTDQQNEIAALRHLHAGLLPTDPANISTGELRGLLSAIEADGRVQAEAPSEPDMRAICEKLGFDPTNHHNAAKCPYCRPSSPPAPDVPEREEHIADVNYQRGEEIGYRMGLAAARRATRPPAEGWKLVPVSPTKVMVDAGHPHTQREDEQDAHRARGAAIVCYMDMVGAAPAYEARKTVLAEAPKASMFHDAGAVAQCQYCKRYTLDGRALSDRQPLCACGKQHGWSGSFKPPGQDAQWHGPAPDSPAAPAVQAGQEVVRAALIHIEGAAMDITVERRVIRDAARAARAALASPPASKATSDTGSSVIQLERHEFKAEDLLRRGVLNLRKGRSEFFWAAVSRSFGLGSTCSTALAVWAGRHPDTGAPTQEKS